MKTHCNMPIVHSLGYNIPRYFILSSTDAPCTTWTCFGGRYLASRPIIINNRVPFIVVSFLLSLWSFVFLFFPSSKVAVLSAAQCRSPFV